jgi:hypothetical protein
MTNVAGGARPGRRWICFWWDALFSPDVFCRDAIRPRREPALPTKPVHGAWVSNTVNLEEELPDLLDGLVRRSLTQDAEAWSGAVGYKNRR